MSSYLLHRPACRDLCVETTLIAYLLYCSSSYLKKSTRLTERAEYLHTVMAFSRIHAHSGLAVREVDRQRIVRMREFYTMNLFTNLAI